MHRPSVSLIILTCLSIALAGCSEELIDPSGAEDLDVPLDPAALSVREKPPAGSNGMRPSCFWDHSTQQALRSLGNGPLDQGGGILPQIALSLVGEPCRHVLEKAVQCALPPDQELLDPVTGDIYGGWWGMATSWRGAALDTIGRRDVTACLLQNLNVSGASVPIALEGPNLAITKDAELSSIYSIEESTAFGDLFSSGTPLLGILPAFNAYVCWENLLPTSCGTLDLPLLSQRICDDAILCGMVPLGPCSLLCAPNGPYNKCKPLLGLLAPYWTQTVRVRLDPETCH